MADASLPGAGGMGGATSFSTLSSALSSKIRVGPVSFFSFQLHPSLLSAARSAAARLRPRPGRPRCRHLHPVTPLPTPTLLGSFCLFVSVWEPAEIANETKANQTPPRIARPPFPSWSFAWRSRPSCPTDIKQRFAATTLWSLPFLSRYVISPAGNRWISVRCHLVAHSYCFLGTGAATLAANCWSPREIGPTTTDTYAALNVYIHNLIHSSIIMVSFFGIKFGEKKR